MNAPPTPKPYVATPLTLSQLASGQFIEFTASDNLESHQAFTFIELEDRILWGDLCGQWENGSAVYSWIEVGYFAKEPCESFAAVFPVIRYLLNQHHHKGLRSPFIVHNENYHRNTNMVKHSKLIDVVWDLEKKSTYS